MNYFSEIEKNILPRKVETSHCLKLKINFAARKKKKAQQKPFSETLMISFFFFFDFLMSSSCVKWSEEKRKDIDLEIGLDLA